MQAMHKTMENERFSYDPSKGLYSISIKEGKKEFHLPKDWTLERKILALDLTRRGGDPNEPARNFSEDSDSRDLLEHIQRQHPETDVLILAQKVKAKHDQQIEEFLKEYHGKSK